MKQHDPFTERVAALWHSQQTMAGAKKWHSGKRKGQERVPTVPLEFTRQELHDWLMREVGTRAIRCPYLGHPIDISTLTIDHKVPRSLGGRYALENMIVCSKQANFMKGDMSHDGFVRLLKFADTLAPADWMALSKRLADAHHGSRARFFRGKR